MVPGNGELGISSTTLSEKATAFLDFKGEDSHAGGFEGFGNDVPEREASTLIGDRLRSKELSWESAWWFSSGFEPRSEALGANTFKATG